MTREIQREVGHARRIATSRTRRAGVPQERGLVTAQVIAQRIFPEDGVNYLTHPLAERVNRLVDLAMQGEDVARARGRQIRHGS